MDPGTTTAVAVIGLKGRLLLLWSMKHATQAAVSRMIIDCGRPVVIAGDVNPPPALLEKIASGFSSKLFYPESNMTIAEKLKIAENTASMPAEGNLQVGGLQQAVASYGRTSMSAMPLLQRCAHGSA